MASNTRLNNENYSKWCAAHQALSLIKDGMKLGLGTGSTTEALVRLLPEYQKEHKLDLALAATSKKTHDLATELGLKILDPNDLGTLDLTLDGTDEIDADLNLIKGGGGALLREKIIATSSQSMIVIAASTKKVEYLGNFPLPIEVVKFGWQNTLLRLISVFENLGYRNVDFLVRRRNSDLFITDEHHVIIDFHLQKIENPEIIENTIKQTVGVVESGLFVGICKGAIIGHPDGYITELTRPK